MAPSPAHGRVVRVVLDPFWVGVAAIALQRAGSYTDAVKAKFQGLMQEYGRIAVTTYFGIFFCVLAAFYVAILTGFTPEGVSSGVGTLAAAWVATKLTQPLRIGATLVLTPVLASALQRFRPKVPAPQDDA